MQKEKRTCTVYSPKEAGHPIISQKPSRNSKCTCGSGKKSKHCCGSDTKFFITKPGAVIPKPQKLYYSKITANHWCAKNKLHEEANEVGLDMERRIISESELAAFRDELTMRIDLLNQKYHRCNPLKIEETPQHTTDVDETLFISNVFHLTLHRVKS